VKRDRRRDQVAVWPYLTRLELLAAIAALIVLTVWSIVLDAPLEAPADLAHTPVVSKAPWYFVGLQELLVYFDPWIAGVVLPGLIVVGLMLLPYLDPNPKGSGYYTLSQRWFAVSTFVFAFVVLWIGPMLVGTFLRGPGWHLFWPWEVWDAQQVSLHPNRDFNEWIALLPASLGLRAGGSWVDGWQAFFSRPNVGVGLGLAALGSFYGLGMRYFAHIVAVQGRIVQWLWRRDIGMANFSPRSFRKKMGRRRYYIAGFFYVTMIGLVLKILFRLAFHIQYIVRLPWIDANI
jgi:hypothetical protein